jgi:WXG100 family type VII secretion target
MRVTPVGGSQMATGNTYTITTETVAPCDVSGYPAATIEAMFGQLDPSMVEQAGAAYNKASDTLHKIADNLASHMSVLAESWQGQAAQAAGGSFRQLHETANGLSQASQRTGSVLSWLGSTILPFYKNYKAPHEGILGDIEQAIGMHPQDTAARQVLQRLNNRLVEANGGLPPSVSRHLPNSTGMIYGHSGTAFSGSGGASGRGTTGVAGGGTAGASAGGGSGGVPGIGGGAAGLGGGSGSPGRVGSTMPNRPAVTHLATYSPPGGTGVTAPGGPGPSVGTGSSPGAGGGPGLLPVTSPVIGPGSGGLPGDPAVSGPGGEAGVPGAEAPAGELISPDAMLGRDGMISGVPAGPEAGGLDAAVPGADGVPAGAGSAGQGGQGMSPMGGGAGQRERERYRQAWLPEDADVWEAAAGLTSPVIGG